MQRCFLLLARLLALPMLFIAVTSLNVHQLWEGKKTAKCPNNFDWDCSWVIFWSLSWYKELKHTKKLFTGHALGSLLIQMQNISFRSLGMCRKQNFEIVVGVRETRFFWGIFRSMCYMCVFFAFYSWPPWLNHAHSGMVWKVSSHCAS